MLVIAIQKKWLASMKSQRKAIKMHKINRNMKDYTGENIAAIIGYIVLLVVFFAVSCKKEYYKSIEETCVKYHYENRLYETGGLMVPKSTWSANRKEVRLVKVCDSCQVDTVIRVHFVLK